MPSHLTYKRWTEEEKDLLRRRQGKQPYAVTAAELGRSVKQVREAAKRFCELVPRRKWADYRERFLALHAEGKNWTEVAGELGIPTRMAEWWGRRCGLTPNGWTANSTVKRRRRKLARWLERNEGAVWYALKKAGAFPRGNKDARVTKDLTARELFQEVCAELLRKVSGYDRRRGGLINWIVLTARCHLSHLRYAEGTRSYYDAKRGEHRYNLKRGGRVTHSTLQEDEPAVTSREEEPGRTVEVLEEVAACLSLVDAPTAHLLQQHYGFGVTCLELGRRLGVSKETVRVRINNALETIRSARGCGQV